MINNLVLPASNTDFLEVGNGFAMEHHAEVHSELLGGQCLFGCLL